MDQLASSIQQNLPTGIALDDEILNALISTFGNGVPQPSIQKSSDYNDGAFSNEIRYLLGYAQLLYAGDMASKTGDLLDSMVQFYTGIGRFIGETDPSLLNRFLALVQRGVDTWGTPLSVIGALSHIIAASALYLQEDPNWIDPTTNPNLIMDGDFEAGGGAWTLAGGAIIAGSGYTFSGSKSLGLPVSGAAGSQVITTPVAGDYRLTYVSNGSGLFISVKDNNSGLYYNGAGVWQASSIGLAIASTTDWHAGCLDIIGASATSLLIECYAQSGAGYIDMVELGVQPKYPGFKVYVSTTGIAGSTSLALVTGNIDSSPPSSVTSQGGRFLAPVDAETTDLAVLGNLSYIGDEYSGVTTQEYMQQVFEFLRTGGVRASLTILSRT